MKHNKIVETKLSELYFRNFFEKRLKENKTFTEAFKLALIDEYKALNDLQNNQEKIEKAIIILSKKIYWKNNINDLILKSQI